MSCECYDEIDKALRKQGLRLPVTVTYGKGRIGTYKRAAIMVERVKPRVKMPLVFATFCPVCGEAYDVASPAALG